MATINSLSNAANQILNDAIESGSVTETDTAGVYEFLVDGVTILASENTDIEMGDVNAAMLIGNANADITGNDRINIIVGNDGDNVLTAGAGNDLVATGAGNDTIRLGDGDDCVFVDGPGTKTIDGGAGNDLFVITCPGIDSHITFTGLNVGDKLRLYADANGDGQINMEDVDLENTFEADGNTTLTLVDGTTVVLEGITGLFENANFELGTDADAHSDGNDGLFVDIS